MAEEPPATKLHPAEHRAYRELYAFSRQLVDRWGRLIAALEGTPQAEVLTSGRSDAEALLDALPGLTEYYGLHGGIMAQGVGARIAGARSAVSDRSVDAGAVMRMSVLDIEHLRTLLGHLAALAQARDDKRASAFCREWEKRLAPQVEATRLAAVSLGDDPDRAAAPIDDTTLTRVAHGVGWVFGTVGEAIDRAAGSRGSGHQHPPD